MKKLSAEAIATINHAIEHDVLDIIELEDFYALADAYNFLLIFRPDLFEDENDGRVA